MGIVAWFAVCGWLAGCGGSGDEQIVDLQRRSDDPSAPAAGHGANGNQPAQGTPAAQPDQGESGASSATDNHAAGQASASSSESSNSSSTLEDLESIPPGDFFEIAGVGDQFEIVDPTPENLPNQFSVTTPQAENSSSTFEVAQLGDSPQGGPVVARQSRSNIELPEGYRALEEFGYSEQGWPLRIQSEKDQQTMCFIPAGVCLVGTDEGPSHAGPQISVYIDAFYIDVSEVTVGQFERYRQSRRAERKTIPPEPLSASSGDDFPAAGIDWGDAHAYARWVGKELPTEAEWEKATRGPTGFEHPWGNGQAVWARERVPGQLDPVMSFRTDVSPYGVYDLAGNVREWCADFYSDQSFAEAASDKKGTIRNWTGPRRGTVRGERVVKGGGTDWKSWNREGLPMRERQPDLGFRCVLRISTIERDEESENSSTGTPSR